MPHETYEYIYLSPHLDDAVLSCGGRITQERKAGALVLVVTLMAGDPPAEALDLPTPILADLHTRWELEEIPNPVAVRRAEDREALSLLDADIAHWEWPECVYRRHPDSGDFMYPTEASLWNKVHPADRTVTVQMAQRLSQLPLASAGRVYVPLTVGGHVDHHIAREAAERWGAPGAEIVYYEEYPYAEHPEALRRVLEEGSGWRSKTIELDEAALTTKAAAVACYRSQISTFFRDTEEIPYRVRAYASVAGAGRGWAERYWHRD